MHHVIVWPIAIATALLVAGCSDVIGPDVRDVGDSIPLVDVERKRKAPPVPDSVGIPPMPIPPIYEELPPILDGDG
jgi:hypothetical protein